MLHVDARSVKVFVLHERSENMKRVTINLNDKTYENVKAVAFALDMTPSQLISAMMSIGLSVSDKLTDIIEREYKKNIGE